MAIPAKNCKQCGENKAVNSYYRRGAYLEVNDGPNA